ncbi:hypothetical protein AMECASPLE_033605 [Ameca splendens]|uniref:Uncharacterized protein n=1 Tax=Ameca splendens TaxID=208324 RepID=A0ABV0ZUM6_9TELE
MSKDSNHSLLHWTSPVGILLNSSLLGLPLKNPVHPPPSTAPTSENLGPSYHSGTPLSTIIYLTVGFPVPVSLPTSLHCK